MNDFRIVGVNNVHAQMHFQVYSLVPWKTLIENGKRFFRQEDLSIMLKKNKNKRME